MFKERLKRKEKKMTKQYQGDLGKAKQTEYLETKSNLN